MIMKINTEQWNKTDELCPNCGKVVKKARGITKQNLKRLFTPKMDMNEFLITFMLIMVIVLAFVYNSETKRCREWIDKMYGGSKEDCLNNCTLNCDKIYTIREMNEKNKWLNVFNASNIGINETNE